MNKQTLWDIIRLTVEVENLLLKHGELDLYNVRVEYHPPNKNYTIVLKDVNSETYTILNPHHLGIDISHV